ncbi:T cell receptor beta variable 28 [Plecturocebus cupreus]
MSVGWDNDITDHQPTAWSWEKTYSFFKTAMGIRLLCTVAFCFLEVGLVEVKVTQNPRYLVKKTREKVFLECAQDMDHERMFWYRQDPGLGLRLIYVSYDVTNDEKGDVPDGYSVSREKKEKFSLILESASTNQTSVYLCASSSSTAQHSHILSAQKEQMSERRGPNSGLVLAPMVHLCSIEKSDR